MHNTQTDTHTHTTHMYMYVVHLVKKKGSCESQKGGWRSFLLREGTWNEPLLFFLPLSLFCAATRVVDLAVFPSYNKVRTKGMKYYSVQPRVLEEHAEGNWVQRMAKEYQSQVDKGLVNGGMGRVISCVYITHHTPSFDVRDNLIQNYYRKFLSNTLLRIFRIWHGCKPGHFLSLGLQWTPGLKCPSIISVVNSCVNIYSRNLNNCYWWHSMSLSLLDHSCHMTGMKCEHVN